MIRRVGDSVKQQTKYKHRPGAYAILELNGKVLLTHQNDPVPEFQLPGGGIEPGEQIIPALHREVFEETGWRVSGFRRLGAFRRFTYMPEYDLWAEKLCHVFYGRPTRQICAPLEPGHTAIWALPTLASDMVGNQGDRLFLQKVFR